MILKKCSINLCLVFEKELVVFRNWFSIKESNILISTTYQKHIINKLKTLKYKNKFTTYILI